MTLTQISVGVDGSTTSLDALRWGVGAAATSRASVRAVMTWEMPLLSGLPRQLRGDLSETSLSQRCDEQLGLAIDNAGLGVEIERVIRNGAPGPILAAESIRSDLLVIGRTGQGLSRVAQLMLGSVARYCIHHARGHVAVVPKNSRWRHDATVVVGVDGSSNSIEALRWAVQNLPATASIEAVRAQARPISDLVHIGDEDFEQLVGTAEAELQRDIIAATEGLAGSMPTITPRVETGHGRFVLAAPELRADVVIVGARGQRGFREAAIGSVADHVARNATCPVVIVRPGGPSAR